MDEDPALSLASFEQIIGELEKRFTAVVLIHERPSRDATDDSENFGFSFHGGRSVAIGMVSRVRHVLLKDEDGDFVDVPDEDE